MRDRIHIGTGVAIFLILAASLPLVLAESEKKKSPGEEALKAAEEAGKKLFSDQKLGTREEYSCARCHADPKRPKMHLAKRVNGYPKWDRGAKRVITLGQKIRRMIERNLKGKKLELGGEKLVALEAHLMKLSRGN